MSRESGSAVVDADDNLIERFLAGDRAAFDALYARHRDYVYNIVYGVVGRADEARDVTQEVFLQVYRSLASFRRGARFSTWLYRVAVNRAVDAARAETRRRWLPFAETMQAEADPKGDPADRAEQQGEQDEVQAALRLVPLKHRDVLVLRYFQELSVEEIAEVLGCTVTAAKVRLHRARLQFKKHYETLYG